MNILELQTTLQNQNISMTAREIANIWGMDETSFSKKKKKGSAIKHKNLVQLEEKLGIKLITPNEIPTCYKNAFALLNEDAPKVNEEYIKVDFYPDVFGSCGSGSFVFSENKEVIDVPRRSFKCFQVFKKYSVINATGDSMQPHILDKDRLIVEHWTGEQIRDNKIYVFRFYDNIFIKRLVLNLDQIIVKSDNKEYPARHIERGDMDNFQLIGRIVGIMREED